MILTESMNNDLKKTYNFLKKRIIFQPVAVRQQQQRLSVFEFQTSN
jgi:hypothetical protein